MYEEEYEEKKKKREELVNGDEERARDGYTRPYELFVSFMLAFYILRATCKSYTAFDTLIRFGGWMVGDVRSFEDFWRKDGREIYYGWVMCNAI